VSFADLDLPRNGSLPSQIQMRTPNPARNAVRLNWRGLSDPPPEMIRRPDPILPDEKVKKSVLLWFPPASGVQP
jgi:hypothetical protein